MQQSYKKIQQKTINKKANNKTHFKNTARNSQQIKNTK